VEAADVQHVLLAQILEPPQLLQQQPWEAVVEVADKVAVEVEVAMSSAQQPPQQQAVLVQATASQAALSHSVSEVLVEPLGEET
jgi:hypothetical protein